MQNTTEREDVYTQAFQEAVPSRDSGTPLSPHSQSGPETNAIRQSTDERTLGASISLSQGMNPVSLGEHNSPIPILLSHRSEIARSARQAGRNQFVDERRIFKEPRQHRDLGDSHPYSR
jgi:hypothetical protein